MAATAQELSGLEKIVLGAALYEPWGRQLTELLPSPDMFASHQHQVIWEAVLALNSRNVRPTPELIEESLRLQHRLSQIGDSFMLYGLPHVRELDVVREHADQIRTHAALRMVHLLGDKLKKVQLADQAEVILYEAGQRINDIQLNLVTQRGAMFGDGLAAVFAELREAELSDGAMTGPTSGFRSVDNLTGGWQPSDLIIIAARPSMGKTTVVNSMARNTAMQQLRDNTGKRVAFFSLEMPRTQLIRKEMSALFHINSADLKRAVLPRGVTINYLEELAFQHTANIPIYYDDSSLISIDQLITTSRRLHAEQTLCMIVIDYLQLVSAPEAKSREQEIAVISRKLKMLAKELNVPVLALSQVGRQVETRPNKRPKLSDLRESGSLEQDADVVVFLYRPEYYKDADELGTPIEGILEMDFAKHRNGALEKIILNIEVGISLSWDPSEIKPASLLDRYPPGMLHF